MKKFNYSKIFAFTLAEVLITLGIIGVVAALTLPSVISNYKKQAYVSQLKKTYSLLSQGFSKYLADNGFEASNIEDSDLFETKEYDGGGIKKTYRDMNFDEMDKVMQKYFKVAKICTENCGFENYDTAKRLGPATFGHNDEDCHNYFLADGAIVQICGQELNVDVNGKKGPNKYGRDVFRFFLYNNSGQSLGGSTGNMKLITGYCDWGKWDDAYSDGRCYDDDVEKGYGWCCAQRIMEEGWQMNY